MWLRKAWWRSLLINPATLNICLFFFPLVPLTPCSPMVGLRNRSDSKILPTWASDSRVFCFSFLLPLLPSQHGTESMTKDAEHVKTWYALLILTNTGSLALLTQLHTPKLTLWKAKKRASQPPSPAIGFCTCATRNMQGTGAASFLQLALEQAQSKRTGLGTLCCLGRQQRLKGPVRLQLRQPKNNSPKLRAQPPGIQQEMKVIFIIEYSFLQLPE